MLGSIKCGGRHGDALIFRLSQISILEILFNIFCYFWSSKTDDFFGIDFHTNLYIFIPALLEASGGHQGLIRNCNFEP